MNKKYFIVKEIGNFGRERYIVKGFKCQQAMHNFLNNQTGFSQKQFIEHTPDGAYRDIPQKSGTYVFAGGQYLNVKTLQPCVLAHL